MNVHDILMPTSRSPLQVDGERGDDAVEDAVEAAAPATHVRAVTPAPLYVPEVLYAGGDAACVPRGQDVEVIIGCDSMTNALLHAYLEHVAASGTSGSGGTAVRRVASIAVPHAPLRDVRLAVALEAVSLTEGACSVYSVLSCSTQGEGDGGGVRQLVCMCNVETLEDAALLDVCDAIAGVLLGAPGPEDVAAVPASTVANVSILCERLLNNCIGTAAPRGGETALCRVLASDAAGAREAFVPALEQPTLLQGLPAALMSECQYRGTAALLYVFMHDGRPLTLAAMAGALRGGGNNNNNNGGTAYVLTVLAGGSDGFVAGLSTDSATAVAVSNAKYIPPRSLFL